MRNALCATSAGKASGPMESSLSSRVSPGGRPRAGSSEGQCSWPYVSSASLFG